MLASLRRNAPRHDRQCAGRGEVNRAVKKVRKRRESIQVQYAAVLERCSDFWSAKSGLVASTRFDLERTPVSAWSDCATSLYTGSSTHYTIGSVTLSNWLFSIF